MEKRPQAIDKAKVREIYFWIINTGDIYFKKTIPLLENYTKKYVKGTFDKKKAVKGFELLIPEGVKSYDKEFGSYGYRTKFNAAEKQQLAQDLYDYYEDILKEMFKKARKLKK